MSTEDHTHVEMADGPGVYVADEDWFWAICEKNARLIRRDAELAAAARSTEDGGQPA